MIKQSKINAFQEAHNITSRTDINQVRTVPLSNGKYVTQISLHNKAGWFMLPGTEHTNIREAEALGAEFLYSPETAQSVRDNYTQADESNDGFQPTTIPTDTDFGDEPSGAVTGKPTTHSNEKTATDRSTLYENGVIVGPGDD